MPWEEDKDNDGSEGEDTTTAAEQPAPPSSQPQQQQLPSAFVDVLQHLPLDVVFQVEVFLPVPTLLGAFPSGRRRPE